MLPPVSVNLPVYTGARTLERQLNSILGQTFGDFRILITDNASTDGTEDICRAFVARDSRIVYRRNPNNMGFHFSYTRNFHDSLASEFIIYASHNDYWHPEYLAECVAVLQKNPDAAVAYSWCQFIDEAGQPASMLGPGRSTAPYHDKFDLGNPDPKRRFMCIISLLGMCTAYYGLFRRDAAIQHLEAMARPGVASDNYLLASLALTHRLLQIPRPLFYREIPIQDESHAARQARLKEFSVGGQPMPKVADSYMYGFLAFLQSYELFFTQYFSVGLTSDEKDRLLAWTVKSLTKRYWTELTCEMEHNIALLSRGRLHASPAGEEPAPGKHRTLDFLALFQIYRFFNRSIDYFPKFPGLYYALALVLILLGRAAEAAAALEEELKNNPTHPESLEILARLRQI